jgi:protein phosphatase
MNKVPLPTINSSALTNIGLVRENNEDSYLNLPEYKLWAVADGMGGHEGGEIASAIAISYLKKAIVKGENLVTAIEQSHHEIVQAEVDGLGVKNIGSTIIALQIQDSQYQIAWVGDSRAYHYRTSLKCLSKDHSYIQLMLDQGLINEADIENNPYKNVITQALGGLGSTIKVDTVKGEVIQGDFFLICSDGLSGEVSDQEIEQIIKNQTTNVTDKANKLIDAALALGGKDNITLILIEIVC